MTEGPAVGGVAVGDLVEIEVGAVAHGGHCVARHAGQVLFVRHSLPGERVLARVTELGPQGRFARADAEQIIDPAPERVRPPCRYAGPGPDRCGGCDFQHVDPPAQRALKAAVVAEQFARLAGIEVTAECEPVPGDQDGLRWRTRAEFAVDPATGRPGLRAHRSHRVIPIEDCVIADQRIVDTGILATTQPTGTVAVDVVAPSVGEPVLVPLALPSGGGPRRSRRSRGSTASRRGQRPAPSPVGTVPEVTQVVGDDTFTLSARGFWQVHPGAAGTFVEHVLATLDPQPGERVLDLYSGVGLFAVPLAQRVGERGEVVAVEADREATAAATRHLAAYPQARAVRSVTGDFLAGLDGRWDLVVLDPPRTGAGREVIEAIARLRPRAVAYVACDPAALARDVATARDLGFQLADLRVFDAFPMTHHIECFATLRPRPRPT